MARLEATLRAVRRIAATAAEPRYRGSAQSAGQDGSRLSALAAGARPNRINLPAAVMLKSYACLRAAAAIGFSMSLAGCSAGARTSPQAIPVAAKRLRYSV